MHRLQDCGFESGQDAIDISFAHDHWMGKDELRRISRLEMLDEMEEWRLLASHYCLAWGWINTDDTKKSPFEAWRDISKTDA
jgi:[phosphatase 2A protein]-leucine-carboxy methyltransferase